MAALAAMLPLTATAQEYSDGGHGKKELCPAIISPVEAYGVHPPGWTPSGVCGRQIQTYVPYYAPLAPTPTYLRYAPWCYFPLMPYYTPYYCGYCPKRLHHPEPPPYGSDGGWGPGPMPGPVPDGFQPNYGVYTSVLKDDTVYWNMGGNGLVPYGAAPPPRSGPPDLVDMIREAHGYAGPLPCPGGGPVESLIGVTPPPIVPPVAPLPEKGGFGDDRPGKEAPRR